MEINIMEDKENKLLGRREVSFMATYESSTPTKEQVKESICKKLNMNPESTEVVRIEQLYGNKASSVLVYSYESKELMQKMAPKVKEKKAKGEPKATAKA
jgi:small subunit ribosomal protein S24e